MGSKYEMRDEDESQRGLIAYSKDLVLQPVHIAFSKPARRAYLTTFLVIATALLLLGFAITAYTLFYLSYIPRIGFERTIHLQFDNVYDAADSRYVPSRSTNPHPYGTTTLSPDIVSAQQYDVVIELSLPRTPDNTGAGNFMLEVNMYAPGEKGSSIMDTVQAGIAPGRLESKALATSRRPAILPYRSPIVELAYKITELHWYLLDWRQEANVLRIKMFENVEFAKGWRNVPSTLKLEVQSARSIQVYAARAIFRARFRGLRWLMYNYRIISAIVFISTFWITELLFAGLAWAALSVFMAPEQQPVKKEGKQQDGERIKQESDAEELKLSDTERTFPTLSGQQTLRYASPTIKREEDETAALLPGTPGIAAEADDEDEDVDFFDSGLGTSMESSASRRESVRKRRGRATARDDV